MALFIKENGSLVQVSVGHEISKPEQQKSVSLDLASGDQIVTPDNGQVLTQVLIKKPETLVAGNIKKDVNIAGVVGSYEGSVDYLKNRINYASDTYSYTNNEVVTIRNYAFAYDKNIISFSSSSVTTLRNSSFYECDNLATFVAPNIITISDNSFYKCSSLVSIDVPLLTGLGNSVFYNCSLLTNINCPLIQLINQSCFYSCSSLTNINNNTNTFSNVVTINSSAFSNCSSIESLYFPVATSISNSAFSKTNSLKKIDLGLISSLGQIFGSGSTMTSPLEDIYLRKTDSICTLSSTSYLPAGLNITIHVPNDLISSYQSATNWSTLYNNGDITFVAIQ